MHSEKRFIFSPLIGAIQGICGYRLRWARPGLAFSPQRAHARSTVETATLFAREHALREKFLRQVALLRRVQPPGEKCGLAESPPDMTGRIIGGETGALQNERLAVSGQCLVKRFGSRGHVPLMRFAASLNIDTQDRQDKQDEKLLHSLQSLKHKPLIIIDLLRLSPLQFPHYIPLFERESIGRSRTLADRSAEYQP